MSDRKEKYSFERLSLDKLCDLAALYKKVYHTPVSQGYLLKKYATQYTGLAYTGFICYDIVGQPVAYYGVIPCFFRFQDQRILAAQSADTMTSPGHRGKGLMSDLSELTFALCRTEGIRLLFGFPNQNAYPVMIHKLGWSEAGKFSLFSVPVKTSWKRHFSNLPGVVTRKIGIGNTLIEQGFAAVDRTEEYLAYKQYNKSGVWKIAQSEVWLRAEKEMIIGDFTIPGDEQYFFDELLKIAAAKGLRKILFQVSDETAQYEIFARRYKPQQSFKVLLKNFDSGIEPGKIKFTYADIDIF